MATGAFMLTGCSGDAAAPTSAAGSSEPASAEAADPLPIVVDYSPTVSDVGALLYLLQHPRVDLRAVTLAGTGESHCESALTNTRALLAALDRADVPVACGRQEPLGDGNPWPQDWRDAADAVPGLDLPDAPSPPGAEIDAADLLAESAHDAEHRDHLVIVALGPLTNLAVAIERHPSLVDEVAMLYSMGGALDVDGNAPNATAEWNYYVDPAAARAVVHSGIPITLVPLDATREVPVNGTWFARLAERHDTAAADALFDLHRETRPWESGFYFWDELTATIAVDESLATIDETTIDVAIEGPHAGRTVRSATGTSVRIATAPDRDRFERELLDTLASVP